MPQPGPREPRGSDDQALDVLARGGVEIVGRFSSSNQALLVDVRDGDHALAAVYKPEAGERPLWDFDPGLHRREHAAYLLSEWLGWHLVPPTLVRRDAPAGIGSFQRFVATDEHSHFFTLDQSEPGVAETLKRLAVFDVVANNADRKSGHVLREAGGRLWAIDHGLCFATGYKLRTVIWCFAGERIPAALLEETAPLASQTPPALRSVLTPGELTAMQVRVRQLLETGRFPSDPSGHRVPWPLV